MHLVKFKDAVGYLGSIWSWARYASSFSLLTLSFLKDSHKTNDRIRQEVTLHFIMG